MTLLIRIQDPLLFAPPFVPFLECSMFVEFVMPKCACLCVVLVWWVAGGNLLVTPCWQNMQILRDDSALVLGQHLGAELGCQAFCTCSNHRG